MKAIAQMKNEHWKKDKVGVGKVDSECELNSWPNISVH